MTSVKGEKSRPVPAAGETHIAVLAGQLMREIRDTFAAEDWGGLRQSHFRLMSQVPRGGISVTALAVQVGMTKQGCGQFVNQLRGSGHLDIRSDPADRRVRVVVRTPLGDRTIKAVEARILRIERSWARQVGRERYADFRAVLQEITDPG
jgi:DNA-binding MarR family transcriptional regulator